MKRFVLAEEVEPGDTIDGVRVAKVIPIGNHIEIILVGGRVLKYERDERLENHS